jgi:ketosteroid isomerase-like protein
MITETFARQFAEEWIAAWNAHDLERILSHYDEDFEMSTPFIVKLMNVPTGTLKGKRAVGEYWRKALAKMPDLHFELINVFTSVDSICIHYKSVLNLEAIEWVTFDKFGKATRAVAHYRSVDKG